MILDIAVLIGASAVPLWVVLEYQRKIHQAKLDTLRDGADYLRGLEDGMRRAAELVDGAHLQTPNATLAASIRKAAKWKALP